MTTQAPPLQINVTTNEHLEDLLCSKGLKVVELYSTWCGTCKSVVPTLRRIRFDKEDEQALSFLTVPCEPIDYLEDAVEHRGKSEPVFLIYRNGQKKATVEGANTPALSQQIMTFTPANADMDDLEENPLYLARLDREKQARGEVGGKDAKGAKKGAKK
mmetsp:Transcript_4925/g.13431  ORF Transcript_4925/g.13431 Transcript_4925/m.13431 type:complete len:159 (+) Transcript_4925:210-686(+)